MADAGSRQFKAPGMTGALLVKAKLLEVGSGACCVLLLPPEVSDVSML